jgi:hypothetical protein
MPVHLRIDGLRELSAALRRLPVELRDEARALVEATATRAEDHVRADYEAHSVSGKLARGLKREDTLSTYGVRVRLVNRANIASIYEYGTELRHTDVGHSTGRMPPARVFVPTVVEERRRLIAAEVALVERAGFKVRGV